MSAAAAASDNFYTVKQVNSMAQSHVGSKIIKPVYFKILSALQQTKLIFGTVWVTVKALTEIFSWNSVATF